MHINCKSSLLRVERRMFGDTEPLYSVDLFLLHSHGNMHNPGNEISDEEKEEDPKKVSSDKHCKAA